MPLLTQYLRPRRNEYNSDMRSASRVLVLSITALACLFLASLPPRPDIRSSSPKHRPSAQPIVIDAASPGRIFDGVGAISGGGGNSRLLIDYPEPQRSQILDYLFKPNYGASIQIFKVEIGADMDSTDGAESSHMHTATDQNYNRGYEWWLMEQARARNPNIKLVALAWGAPAWVGNGNYWSQDMIDYIIKWLQHAQSDHHLTIDYLGGRNEHGYNVQWYKQLKASPARQRPRLHQSHRLRRLGAQQALEHRHRDEQGPRRQRRHRHRRRAWPRLGRLSHARRPRPQ